MCINDNTRVSTVQVAVKSFCKHALCIPTHWSWFVLERLVGFTPVLRFVPGYRAIDREQAKIACDLSHHNLTLFCLV